jgi:ATP-dependent protease ClpP protease subunit
VNKKQTLSRTETSLLVRLPSASVNIGPRQVFKYWGGVTRATNEKLFGQFQKRLEQAPEEELCLLVTCAGGPSGAAMSFYDAVRRVLKPRLTTVGLGDVDSSGVIIFLAGTRRLISPHTTLLLHPAGRRFNGTDRFTATEIEAMAREDRLKDAQYAHILAENSPVLSAEEVLALMNKHTVLTPEEMVRYGLAHAILE